MRRLNLGIIFLLLLLILLTSCNKNGADEPKKPLIITTVYPYELIAKELVGSLINVETLMPPDAALTEWTPSRRDNKRLEEADIIISNGLGIETVLTKSLNRNHRKLIIASSFVDKNQLIKYADKPNRDAEFQRERFNPYIWESPEILTTIIVGLTAEFSRRYPMHKAIFEKNSRLMIMEINRVDGKIKRERERLTNPVIYTINDNFDYFFKHYNIEYVITTLPEPGKNIDPKQLNILTDQIRIKQIKSIGLESSIDPKRVEPMINNLNLKPQKIDLWGTTLKTRIIAGYLYWNWNSLRSGF